MTTQATPQTPHALVRDQKGRLVWTQSMDDVMLEVFLEHLAKGLRGTGGWKKEITFFAVTEAMRDQLGFAIDIEHVENRIKTKRAAVKSFKDLISFSHSGFGWNPDTMMIESDASVWKDAIKANPKRKTYKGKQIPRLLEWVEVLGDNIACGNIQKTGLTVDEDATVASEMDMSSQVQYSDTLLREGMRIHVDNFPPTNNEGGGSHTATSQPSSQSARPNKLPQKKRKSMEGEGNDVIEGIRLVMQNVADSLRVRSEIERERIAVEASKNNALALTWDQICLAIDELDVLDEEQKIAAMELFSQDGAENLKMFFLKMNTNKRASWLLKKLGDN